MQYLVSGTFSKIVEADSEELASDSVLDDLSYGIGCSEVNITNVDVET